MNNPVVIIGAGLSGLYAAHLLQAQNIPYTILESRDRIGGRVLSVYMEEKSFDLGPTWFWPQYEKTIFQLAQKLNVETISQYMTGDMLTERDPNTLPERYTLPANAMEKSFRFRGGAREITEALAKTLPSSTIELGKRVIEIKQDEMNGIIVKTETVHGQSEVFSARAVILAIPPRIAGSQITFIPSLPGSSQTHLLNKPTWMAGQAKIVMTYERPFWRDKGLSGYATSWVGPLQEIHDASPADGSGALFGFFGMQAKIRQNMNEETIRSLVLKQLIRLFGPQAKRIKSFSYKDWSTDIDTAVEEDSMPLRDFPLYGEVPLSGSWENRLYFAGTESDQQFGGHLEGALRSAEKAVMRFLS